VKVPNGGNDRQPLVKSKALHREVEAKGSSRQNSGLKNMNYIRRVIWISLQNKTKSKRSKEI